jgi:Holliday junction resolvasome RuvABC ATP-dependent DNA helicase subunit
LCAIPRSWKNARVRYADIIGQDDSIARLTAFTDFYSKSDRTPEHILILADDGMGRRTIAVALANELGVPCQEVNAQRLEVLGDLTALPY